MEIGSQKESRQRTLAPRLQWSPGCGSAGHLQPLHLCRCWFGKEPGDLVDYIYQGPIILVLLVGPQWEVGQGWAPGGQQRTHPAEMLGRDRVWIGPPAHTLYAPPRCLASRSQLSLPRAPRPDAALSPLWPSGSGQRKADWQISNASDI